MTTQIQHFMKIKLERRQEERLCAKIFFGRDEKHYELVGELRLSVLEWQVLGCALRMGLVQMQQFHLPTSTRYVPVRVVIEGELHALGRAADLKGADDISVYP